MEVLGEEELFGVFKNASYAFVKLDKYRRKQLLTTDMIYSLVKQKLASVSKS